MLSSAESIKKLKKGDSMAQCLRIRFIPDVSQKILYNSIQKKAKELKLEGIVQSDQDTILIVICGSKEIIDDFVDLLHKEILKKSSAYVEIEPFIKDRDYRGVFRIIE